MNKSIILGNVTRDPELKYLESGTAVCKFGLAQNRKYKSNGEDKEEVNFFDMEAFGKLAEVIAEHVTKGKQILTESRVKLDTWETDGQKRSKHVWVLENFDFVGSKNSETSVETQSEARPKKHEDVPF